MTCQWNFHPDDGSREYWLRETNFTQTDLIDNFLDEYRNMKKLECRLSFFTGYATIFLGCLGVVGCILALATLSQACFSQVSFLYFKAVNVIELPYMIFLIEYGVQHFFHEKVTFLRWRSWATLVAYGHGRGLVNVFPAWVNVVVLAAAVERAVACHLPRYFQKINKRSICIAIIASAFPICLAIYIPHVFAVELFYSNASMLYEPVQTLWGHSDAAQYYTYFADTLTIVGAVLHCLTAALVVWGLIKSARLSSSLKREAASENWSRCLDLCYLQMCETIPLAISHIFRVAANQMAVNKEFFVLPYSAYDLPKALANVRTARLNITFQMLAVVVGAVAHSTGFYFYVVFCPSIRRGFVQLVEKLRVCKCDFEKVPYQKANSETELQTLRANM